MLFFIALPVALAFAIHKAITVPVHALLTY